MSYPNSKGLEMAISESRKFDEIVKETYALVAQEVYGNTNTPDVAAFVYGSPGRIEMVGGDSDADVFIIERVASTKSRLLKRLFKDKLAMYDFSKIDMPDWGSLAEIKTYLEKSLVEGNQVLETRFIAGDKTIVPEVKNLKRKYNTTERALKNIIFNRLYFNEYFKQKSHIGYLNIKYCHGGSRDLLFIYWYDRLDMNIKQEKRVFRYRPAIEIGLSSLLQQRKITQREFRDALEATSFIMMLRKDILKINRVLPERGLTFLDQKTSLRLQGIGYPSPQTQILLFEKHRLAMMAVERVTWNETLEKAESIMYPGWSQLFRQAYEQSTPEEVRRGIRSDDLLRIGLIWGASDSNQTDLFSELVRENLDTEDWATIGSIICSPLCDAKTLEHFSRNILREEGYGYLLRVVARNKNVSKATLESIANDPQLALRYTEVAKAALYGGHEKANKQI